MRFRSLLASICACCLLSLSALATSVRGTLVDGSGKPMISGTLVFTLQNCGNNPPLLAGGIGTLVDTTKTVHPISGGVLIDTIVGNDQISCGGVLSNTFWQVSAYSGFTGTTPTWSANYIITGGLWNANTAVPVNVIPSALIATTLITNPAPGVNQFIVQQLGTSLTITGTVNVSITGTASAASMASALDHTPVLCPAGQVALGITATGDASCINSVVLTGTVGTAGFAAGDGTVSSPGYSFTSTPNTGLWKNGSSLALAVGGIDAFAAQATGVFVGSGGLFGFSSGAGASAGTPDVSLFRDSAGILALRNGTNPQVLRVYGTTTGSKFTLLDNDGTNGHVYVPNTQALFLGNATQPWEILAAGTLIPFNDNAVDLGSASKRVASLYMAGTLNLGGNIMPATAGTSSIGDVTKPAKDLFFAGLSSSPGINNFQLTGVATGARVVSFPDNTGTVAETNLTQVFTSGQGFTNLFGGFLVVGLGSPSNQTFTTTATGGTLANSTTYYYKVTATNSVGEGLPSTETSLATAAGGPGTATITVNWSPVPGAGAYNIYRATSPGAEVLVGQVSNAIAGPSNSISYVDVGGTIGGALPTVNTTGFIQASINTEASAGSVFTIPVEINFQAGGCTGTTALSSFDYMAAGAATPACLTGSPVTMGVMNFAQAGNQAVQATYRLAKDFCPTCGTDFEMVVSTTALSQTATMEIDYSCVATNGTASFNPAFNILSNTIAVTTAAVANRPVTVTLLAQNLAGCTGGNLVHIQVKRADTNLTANPLQLENLTVRYRRAIHG